MGGNLGFRIYDLELHLRDIALLRAGWADVAVNDAVAVGEIERRRGHVLVRDRAEEVGDAVEAGAALVVGFDGPPGGLLDVGVAEHFILGAGVFRPFGNVHLDQLQMQFGELLVVKPALQLVRWGNAIGVGVHGNSR